MYTRTRTMGTFPRSNMGVAVYTPKVGTATTIPLNVVNDGNIKTTSDVVTKRYKRVSGQGGIVNNPFSSKETTYSFSHGTRNGTYKYTPPSNSSIVSVTRTGNNGVPYYLPPELSLSSKLNEAALAALNNVEPPRVEGIPFIADLRRTIDLLRNPISGFTKLADKHVRVWESSRKRNAKLYDQATKLLNSPKDWKGLSSSRATRIRTVQRRLTATRKFPSAEAYAQALASSHLSFMFGVKPFVKDMHELLGIINDAKRTKTRFTARGYSSLSSSGSGTSAYNDGEVTGTNSYTYSTLYTVRAGILYEVNIDLGLSKLGLTVSDIPSALWELTPWSFVFDWVTNLGDVISALTPKVGVTYLSQWYTIQKEHNSKTTLGPITGVNPDYAYTGGGDTRVLVVKEKTRIPATLSTVVFPEITVEWNLNRTLLSASLLTQQLSKISKLLTR